MKTFVWLWLWLWMCAAAGGERRRWAPSGRYAVQSTLLLSALRAPEPERARSEAGNGTGRAHEVGYRLQGSLTLEPAWIDPDPDSARDLLRFRLEAVQLRLRGAHARDEWDTRGSAWDAQPRSEFYALRERGAVRVVYLDPADPPDLINYKRALISLFQFQLEGGERRESDVSGECDILYEILSPDVFRKIKRRCAFEAAAEGLGARRVSRYTLTAERDALSALHAEELVWLSADAGEGAGGDRVGVKARSWHALQLQEKRVAPADARGELEAALAALPAHLVETPLPLPLPLTDDDDDEYDDEPQSLESALKRWGSALSGWEAGAGGTLEQAEALRPLLRALRAAPASALRDLLHRADLQQHQLAGLLRALGLGGSRAGWDAARSLLAPADQDALENLTHHYLAGLALADAPEEETVAEVLKLGEEAKLPSIAESALLAGASAAARGGGGAARGALLAALGRCRDEECRAGRLRALGNLRRADVAPTLLAAAERGGARAAQAALGALRSAPRGAVGAALLDRAALIAGNASRSLPERALALELVVERTCDAAGAGGAVVPLRVIRLARTLMRERGAAAHELRRALWQRLDTLSESGAVRALRRVMPADLGSWDARAPAGTTSVLRRATGWSGGGWETLLDSAQLASRGVLRRGAVSLLATAPATALPEAELLTVEVWTRGLEAMAGTGAGASEGEAVVEEEEGMACGLQLSVAGRALRAVPLFSSQAELLSHVWAGTGSAPTPVLRALLPARGGGAGRGGAALQAGAVLRADADAGAAALALALDASGSVSLWHRTARARLALRGAAHASVRGRVVTAWSSLRAEASAGAAVALRIAADLDFYDGVALCVRAHVDPHDVRMSERVWSRGGSRGRRVSLRRETVSRRAGRTLALGRDNDAACRLLRAADEHDDD